MEHPKRKLLWVVEEEKVEKQRGEERWQMGHRREASAQPGHLPDGGSDPQISISLTTTRTINKQPSIQYHPRHELEGPVAEVA